MASIEDNHTSLLNFQDFVPPCVESAGIIKEPVYEEFSALVIKANEWISKHPELQLVSCEVLEVPCKPNIKGHPSKPVAPENAYFELELTETGFLLNPFIHVLRIWYCIPEETERTKYRRLAYMNVVPQCLDPGGIFKSPKFETMSDMMSRLNAMLGETPIEGELIGVHTYNIRFNNWKEVNADSTFYNGSESSNNLQGLRVFFLKDTRHKCTYIDFMDFAPECVKRKKSVVQKSEQETLNVLSGRAAKWLRDSVDITFVNLQTVWNLAHSLSKEGRFDTKKAFSKTNPPAHVIYYLRIFYTREKGDKNGTVESSTADISTKCMVPEPTGKGTLFKSPTFESMASLNQRMASWLEGQSHLCVMAAETIPLPCTPREKPICDLTATCYSSKLVGFLPLQWVYTLKVHVTGMEEASDPDGSVIHFRC